MFLFTSSCKQADPKQLHEGHTNICFVYRSRSHCANCTVIIRVYKAVEFVCAIPVVSAKFTPALKGNDVFFVSKSLPHVTLGTLMKSQPKKAIEFRIIDYYRLLIISYSIEIQSQLDSNNVTFM